jgi:hypothetical protein
VKEVRYGAIGTPEGIRRLETWARSVAGFIDIPPVRAGHRAIEPQHVPFPGFEQAFGARWRTRPLGRTPGPRSGGAQ